MGAGMFRWAAAAAAVGATLMPGAAGAVTNAPQGNAPDRERLSHALAPSKLVLRQTLTYTKQNTWVAGVKITEHGGSYFGRGERLRVKLGPSAWSCTQGTVAWRGGAAFIGLESLGTRTSCDLRNTAVTAVTVNANAARLSTEFGSVRVGQRWAGVPKRLRAKVTARLRFMPHGNRQGGVIQRLGRYQDVCGRHRAIGWRMDPPSPASVHVGDNGRVIAVEVHPRIVEGNAC